MVAYIPLQCTIQISLIIKNPTAIEWLDEKIPTILIKSVNEHDSNFRIKYVYNSTTTNFSNEEKKLSINQPYKYRYKYIIYIFQTAVDLGCFLL